MRVIYSRLDVHLPIQRSGDGIWVYMGDLERWADEIRSFVREASAWDGARVVLRVEEKQIVLEFDAQWFDAK